MNSEKAGSAAERLKEGLHMTMLDTPLTDNRLPLKNRLVFPPIATAKCDEDGRVNREILDYYEEKSHGGDLSLIIIESSFIAQQGRRRQKQLSIADDEGVERLKELADVIHRNGTRAVMQLNHVGSAADHQLTGMAVVGPSAIVNPGVPEATLPRALTTEEIQVIIDQFGTAARRVKLAGFDGVQIHSAHGYLLDQFYSPLTNHRTDDYGGDVLGRIRIHLDIIKTVREAVGEDYPVLLRLGACDYQPGGTSVADSLIAAQAFEKAGIDILDISGGLNGYTIPGEKGQGYFAPLAESIKKVITIPVILTGGITEVEAAERLLAEGKADLIGVGRGFAKFMAEYRNRI